MRSLRKLWLGGVVAAALALPVSAGEAASVPHRFLEELCDRFGPRLTGSPGNAAAMEHLVSELRALGYAPEKRGFTMPGWERGADAVEVIAPFRRALRVAALGYVDAHAAFEAEMVDIKEGRPADYPAGDVRGKVGVLAASTPLQTREVLANAAARGLGGILFIDREGGGQLLARTGSFQGKSAPLPIYSITQEEGRWLQRLLAREVTVRVRMETRSRCRPVETANLAVRIPGREAGRIIVGAHFDSWDLGQGAMDNGIGTAQLYAMAHALRGVKPRHTIELVWFNGEEQGLWGSRQEAARLGDAPVVLMINLDMVGVPIGVNALGDDSLVPALKKWHDARATKLPKGVENLNWLASDHTPYQLAGVRTVTFNGPIPRESVRHYHDMADSIDKVPAALLDDSTQVILEVLRALADDATLAPFRRSREETRALFTTPGLDRRMRAMDYWPFD